MSWKFSTPLVLLIPNTSFPYYLPVLFWVKRENCYYHYYYNYYCIIIITITVIITSIIIFIVVVVVVVVVISINFLAENN